MSDPLKTWLRSFPYEDVKAEVAQVQQQVQSLNLRLIELSEAIQLYERHMAFEQQRSNRGAPEPDAKVVGTPTLREAIRSLLITSPGTDWSTEQLRNQLVHRGWLPDSQQGKNNMFAMLSMMAKKGQVDRIRTGWYRLPNGSASNGSEVSMVEERA